MDIVGVHDRQGAVVKTVGGAHRKPVKYAFFRATASRRYFQRVRSTRQTD